ncbi:hypothetical protein [Flavobacterium seoulense]|uniref:Quinol oxidase subunit 4 n=1 Tax=Flavobacterium seoulense TaxID=1492738 RepID=A0A066WME2_9FLAO|nr:hypothetical protein [Flavobacterium seoulense]KDN55197.1 hypothetical protein FEM21_17880 [Flavobacterium seoulense]
MKPLKNSRFFAIILIALFSISLSNCSVGVRTNSVKSKPLPPGQAKKITGEKSAKRYAPGQNK